MISKKLREFDINIQSLSKNENVFSFQLSEKLFLFYDENNDLKDINGICKLIINKTNDLMEMYFDIEGSVNLICDRTLKKFNYNLKKEDKIIVKFGKLDEEINEEIITIKYNTSIFNVSKFIYDFFLLSIPIKRLHPSLENENIIDSFVFSTKDEKKKIDPRLELLRNIKT